MVIKTPPSIGPRRRAVNADLKDQRRSDILAAALRLLSERPYATITMSDVAAAAGVAKGTSYLYFPTRKALFLQLLVEHYLSWFDAFDAQLQTPAASLDQWIDGLLHDLTGRPLLLQLMGVLHAVLEHNVPVTEVLAFKRQLAQRMNHSGAALEQALQLPSGSGHRLLLWCQAIIPGLAHMAAPPAALRTALQAAPDLSGFVIDFSTELRRLLLALISGLHARPEISA